MIEGRTLRRAVDAAWAAEDDWRDLDRRLAMLIGGPHWNFPERSFAVDLRRMRDKAEQSAQRALQNYWEVRCLLRLVDEAGPVSATATVDTDVDFAYELYLLGASE